VTPEEDTVWMPGPDAGTYFTWPVRTLWEQAADLVTEEVPVTSLSAHNSVWWFESGPPTLTQFVDRARRMLDADLSFPVLLAKNGWVLDGGHRIAKTLLLGKPMILIKRFLLMPRGFTKHV
jgi:hypothetical protein